MKGFNTQIGKDVNSVYKISNFSCIQAIMFGLFVRIVILLINTVPGSGEPLCGLFLST